MVFKVTRNTVIALLVFILMLIVLWLIVYRTRLFQIEEEVEQMEYVDSVNTTMSYGDIETLTVVAGDNTYTLDELMELGDAAPTVVTVDVVYTDGSEESKSSYVVYDDIEEPTYVDGLYGKVILPMGIEDEEGSREE